MVRTNAKIVGDRNMQKIAAGIVTFNPDISRLKENVEAIYTQVEQTFLVDNGSENIAEIEDTFAQYSGLTILKNSNNEGIAKALNQMVEQAVHCGMEWTLTLDQDSIAPANMIEGFLPYMEQQETAMLVPVIRDRVREIMDMAEEAKEPYTYVEMAITSGTLMKNDVWKQVQGFDEKLFIDYVDFDYCMKVKIAGYQIVRINDVILLHELGNATEIKCITWLGNLLKSKKLLAMRYTSNHSPIRLYYVTRNQLYYIRKYEAYLDKKRAKRGIILGIIMKLIFEGNRVKKARAICKGIKDSKKLS